MTKKSKSYRIVLVAACQLTAIVTGILLLGSGDGERLLLAFATPLIVLAPEIVQRLFRCRLNTALYTAAVLYALGPMMGHCWKFYYILPGWDKILHGCGGIMFFILGMILFHFMSADRPLLGCLVFALCFSIAVSVVWEFIEYGADCLLGMDMQSDCYVSGINSYLLGAEKGVTGSIPDIGSVIVNGSALPGYLDIGLHDTMQDMLLESACSVLFGIILFLDKGRHPLVYTGD